MINKKLGLSYSVVETFEAGVELLGHEVKALREKLGSLDGSKVIIRGGEAFLVGSYIPPYQPKNTDKEYDPHRTRRLLVSKKELSALARKEESGNLTMHPVSWYTKGSLVKCEVALCKKVEKHDKREKIKKEISRRESRAS